jgi:rhamnogalacturonan endolyase
MYIRGKLIRCTGSATVTSSLAGDTAVVSIKTSTIVSISDVLLLRKSNNHKNKPIDIQSHYVIVRSGINTLYLGTFASAEPTVGELRLIARLSKSALPNGIPEAEVNGGTAIEGSDVFLLNGQTRSKFYSSVSGVSLFMLPTGTYLFETRSVRSDSLKIKCMG